MVVHGKYIANPYTIIRFPQPKDPLVGALVYLGRVVLVARHWWDFSRIISLNNNGLPGILHIFSCCNVELHSARVNLVRVGYNAV